MRDQPYGCLSHVSPHGFALDDKWWPTSEPVFQAQAFAGTDHEEGVRQAASPTIAARIGRSRHRDRVKDDVTRSGVRRTFETHTDIRALLPGIGDGDGDGAEEIIEDAPHDSYWGVGGDGSGTSRWGESLMEARDTLRERNARGARSRARGAGGGDG